MMHLHLLGIAVAAAVLIRLFVQLTDRSYQPVDQQMLTWQRRWYRALIAFLVPPLLLLTSAIAVVVMGYSTTHPWDGQLSYAVSLAFVLGAIAIWIYLSWVALKTRQEIHRYPQVMIETGQGAKKRQVKGRILEVSAVFSAQVGLWPSELVISQGLLSHLDDEHLEAVLAHEAGHDHYQDTFWFFWLGGLRRLTKWLPYSETLWQDLLLLREIRADKWAAQSVDTLVLAESLMSVMTAPLVAESVCAAFSCAAPHSRLAQRIDALLCEDVPLTSPRPSQLRILPWQWMAIAFALTPLLTIPFHY
ncbi:MAG: M56 family metallopeptidase [Phormidesmis sp.]